VERERLSESEWRAQAEEHFARVHAFAQAARDRAARREKHPVYDFLTKYYPFKMGKFEKWQPGYGVEVLGADHYSDRHYSTLAEGGQYADPSKLEEKEIERHRFTLAILRGTQSRQAVYSCFGLHEWAMVYTGADVRHRESAPLRLSQEEIDAVVRARPLVCTHFDAFRFFSPEAQPMNKHQPTLHDRDRLEQPGCIHANMDLYKWAFKSMPWVGSDLVWDCFQLALRARAIDMKASPYDLSEWGYDPIKIETDQGRVEYQRVQKQLEAEGRVLRDRLIRVLESTLGSHSAGVAS